MILPKKYETFVRAGIVAALFLFEIFNYKTTEFALRDILGKLGFFGIPLAIILAIAFCCMDFMGLAMIMATIPHAMTAEMWYLGGAWLLAATVNAAFTWWGVAANMAANTVAAPIRNATVIVPIAVAIIILMIRVLLIGAFILSKGERGTSKPRR